ncbi:MAG: type II toxin-antitoxin system prevent-host-death family antitoxin [Spirochaetales bacterium]|nr:type II toxin-antitoxin system prevent-host-death family antitoxin [Spirochaetales bacterium]
MPVIRPSSDLRNKYNEISEFCQQYTEPLFITKNGKGDLVVMSIETYELLTGKKELYNLLDEGLRARNAGQVAPMNRVITEIRTSLKK